MSLLPILISLLGDEPELPKQTTDWDALIGFAKEQRLLPQLHRSLSSGNLLEFVPETTRQRLSDEIMANTIQEIQRARQLLEVIGILSADGIESRTFKGVCQAQLLFGSPAGRSCIDIDILVRPEDFHRAQTLLMEHGFQYHLDWQPTCWAKFHHAVALYHGQKHISLDLHHRFFVSAYPFRLDLFSQPCHPVEILGETVLTLTPPNLFAYLCLHGAKHCWKELRWLHDVKVLAQTLSEEELQKATSDKSLGTTALVALGLLERVWGVPFPPAVVSTAKSRRLTEQAFGFLHHGVGSWRSYHSYQNASLDGAYNRIRHLLWTAFTPQVKDLKSFDLPPSLWLIYYPYRLYRLAFAGLRKIANSRNQV